MALARVDKTLLSAAAKGSTLCQSVFKNILRVKLLFRSLSSGAEINIWVYLGIFKKECWAVCFFLVVAIAIVLRYVKQHEAERNKKDIDYKEREEESVSLKNVLF
jgi:hypothetical protein